MNKKLQLLIFITLTHQSLYAWGFFAHKKINEFAITTLPTEMVGFYKLHSAFIAENAVNPDRRRYSVEGEAPKHYIDLDTYPDSLHEDLIKGWDHAVGMFSKDTLVKHGILPWNLHLISLQLTKAFKALDAKKILKLSSDMGHYIADAHVPLHTTRNYNGQLTGQHGIHGFWESRIPEVLMSEFDLWVGKAKYIENLKNESWTIVLSSHMAVDSVLAFEKELSEKTSPLKKYEFEERNGHHIKTYSRKYVRKYHQKLDHQVENRMRASIRAVGSFWYTCWKNAGRPNLNELLDSPKTEEDIIAWHKKVLFWKKTGISSRTHESDNQ